MLSPSNSTSYPLANIKQSKQKTQNRLLSTVPTKQNKSKLVCADPGSNKTLIRESDAASAQLTVHPTTTPLAVQFPDGVVARSTGTTNIALPATTTAIPAHVFPDNALNQSLFSIIDITDKGYDVTFQSNGVAIQYHGAPIYFQEKLPTDLFWQLPLSSALADTSKDPVTCIANHSLALPSDNDFIAFMHAAFGSPAISTFLRALRRKWLDTIPRLTAALVSANRPNSVATALGHLDQTRQGLDSTKIKPPVAPPPEPPPSISIDDTSLPEPTADELDSLDPYDPDGNDSFNTDQSPLLFCKTFNTADVDASARFTIPSSRRNEYQLLSYFKGYVHVEPLPSRHHNAYIDAYKRTYAYWTQYGPVPDIVRLDNESSVPLEINLYENLCYVPILSPRKPPRQPRGACDAHLEESLRRHSSNRISQLSTQSMGSPIGACRDYTELPPSMAP